MHKGIELEADFIVFVPDYGYVCIEVKGGAISCEDGEWFSTNEKETVRIKDPGRQVQGAAHALDRYLSGSKGFSSIPLPFFTFAVAFPQMEVNGSLGSELPRELIIDMHDLGDVKQKLTGMFEGKAMLKEGVARAQKAAFISALAPRFSLVPSLSAAIRNEGETLIALTDEQKRIFEGFDDVPNLAVKGGAGTGKTLVGMEKAARLALDGRRTLFLCYNRSLAEHLTKMAQGFEVMTFHQLCIETAIKAKLFSDTDSLGNQGNEFWAEKAPQLLEQALNLLPDLRWDAIIVDEGQDFTETMWLLVDRLISAHPHPIKWVFYDPFQNIFGADNTEKLVKELGYIPYQLKLNCRNTKKIAQCATSFIHQSPAFKANAPEGLAVSETSCKDEKEMIDAVRKTLHHLLNEARLKPEQVVVLTTRSVNKSPLKTQKTIGNYTLVDSPQELKANEIWFTSLQRFKGLEADAVILCDVQDDVKNCTPLHMYVGTSRAKHILAIARYRK